MANNNLKDKEMTRKTFVMSEEDYKYIISLVYKKKMEGNTTYTQKEALSDIIDHHRQAKGTEQSEFWIPRIRGFPTEAKNVNNPKQM